MLVHKLKKIKHSFLKIFSCMFFFIYLKAVIKNPPVPIVGSYILSYNFGYTISLIIKSLIQFKLGDKKGAIETAKLSLAGATAEKNEDYIKQNKDSIELWSK